MKQLNQDQIKEKRYYALYYKRHMVYYMIPFLVNFITQTKLLSIHINLDNQI